MNILIIALVTHGIQCISTIVIVAIVQYGKTQRTKILLSALSDNEIRDIAKKQFQDETNYKKDHKMIQHASKVIKLKK